MENTKAILLMWDTLLRGLDDNHKHTFGSFRPLIAYFDIPASRMLTLHGLGNTTIETIVGVAKANQQKTHFI
jgi:hypothetical protein